MKVLITQLCLTRCDPMDCSPPGFSVHGISKARKLEWVAISFSKETSWPRHRSQVSCIAGGFFTIWATGEARKKSGEEFQTQNYGSLEMLFFFFSPLRLKKIIILILSVLGLHCCTWAFSSCGEWGLRPTCRARPSHCSGFSSCGTGA